MRQLFYYKMRQKFITKCDRSLLQNATGFLLQNATVITKCDDFITKCGRYYEMRRLLQIATVHAPSCIDLILTNRKCLFKLSNTFETVLSDHHKLVCTILKSGGFKRAPIEKDPTKHSMLITSKTP